MVTKNNDAYGQQLVDAYKDNNLAFEIIERDDSFITASTYAQRYFSDFSKWDAKEKKAIKFAKGSVLDIGCGAGRHSLYLQRKGHEVLAIDNSPGAIKVAKLKGVKNARVLPIEDISKIKQKFDSILMLGNNFGLLGSPTKAKKLLNQMLKITSPDAQIIVEANHPYTTKNPIHLAYHDRNRKKGRMAGQLRIRVRYNTTVGPWFDYLIVSPEEMRLILEGTGWKIAELISNQDKSYLAILKKL